VVVILNRENYLILEGGGEGTEQTVSCPNSLSVIVLVIQYIRKRFHTVVRQIVQKKIFILMSWNFQAIGKFISSIPSLYNNLKYTNLFRLDYKSIC